MNDADEPLARLDFKAMHPRLAYHLNAIPYYDDPYIINGYGNEYREIFKKVALIAFNAEDEHSAITAICKKLKEGLAKVNYKDAKKLLIDFRKQHHAIDSFITSDFGVKAMYYDSNIITDCLHHELMIKKDIFILTVHDEILCERKNIDEVKKQMEISYRKVLKKALIERKVIGKEQPLPDDLQAIVDIE